METDFHGRTLLHRFLLLLGLVVLFPAAALADTTVPLLWNVAPVMVFVLLPVVAIEGYILYKNLHLSAWRAIKVSAVANIISTLVGVPLALVPVGPGFAPERLLSGSAGMQAVVARVAPVAGIFAAVLIPFLLISWWIEYWVARWLLKRQPTTRAILSAEFKANLASYVLLFIATIGIVTTIGYQSRWQGSQAAAVGSLRTINTSEVTYASAYEHGFSTTLKALGGQEYNPSTVSHAGLISDGLASGHHYGYVFSYTPGPPDASGKINSYTLTARPLKYKETGTQSFFTDESGVIRFTTEDRSATVEDEPIHG